MTEDGSSLNWAICALHAVLFLGVLFMTIKAPARRRVFYYISLLILFITTILYFVLASNLGSTAVRAYLHVGNIVPRTREIFWARWVAYFLNFSLAIFALQLLSTVDWPSVWFSTFLTMIWAALYLGGAHVVSRYKWGFFAFAVFTHLLIAWMLFGVAKRHVGRIEQLANKAFTMLAGYEIFMMMLYAIAWAVCEGSNSVAVDSEMIFYSIFDTLSFGVFAVLLVFQTKKLDFDYLRLSSNENGRLRDGHGIFNNGATRATKHNNEGSTAV